MSALLVVAALLVQGDRIVTLPESGAFKELVRELSKRSGIPIVLEDGIEDKRVAVAAKDVTFWRAIDALCRAHGQATYLGKTQDYWPLRHLTLFAQPWVEHPCDYSGEFKVLIEGWVRATEESEAGREEAVDLYLSVLPPPDTRLTAAEPKWTLAAAEDEKGNDVLLPSRGDERFGKTRLELDDLASRVNSLRHRVRLKPFAGLKRLEGRLEEAASRIEDVRVPLEVGKSVDVPGGRLTVSTLTPIEVYTMKHSRVTLAFEAKGAAVDLESLVDPYGTYDGSDEAWTYMSQVVVGKAVEFELRAEAPTWMELRVRRDTRPVRIPFRFAGLAFKEDRK